jgi:hypothetical protein
MLLVERKRWEGCAPSFSAHVRWGEHGAPVQGDGTGWLFKRCYPTSFWNPGSVYLDRFEVLPSPFDKLRAGSAGL